MSGFKDTFTKDDDKDKLLGYDDTAFYYFACSVAFAIVVPWTYYVFKNFFFGQSTVVFPTRTRDGKEYKYVDTAVMKDKVDRARAESKKWTTNGTVNFIIKVVILAFIWIVLIATTQYCAQQKEIKSFDPFEILQVAPEAETSEIKKAYRKLSLVYHPDKNQGDPVAQTKFIEITKAYEALTDEAARDNYEKYGNPDGQTTSKVGIGLPSFLLEKDNHVLILSGFFFLLLIFIPTVGICYYNRISKYMPNGVLVKTHSMYWGLGPFLDRNDHTLFFQSITCNAAVLTLTDKHRLKDMPELIAFAEEACNPPNPYKSLNDKNFHYVRREIDSHYKDKKGLENTLYSFSAILLWGHMCRLKEREGHSWSPDMVADVEYLLRTSMKLTQELMDIVKEKHTMLWATQDDSSSGKRRSVPQYKGGLGLPTALTILSYRKSLLQAVPDNTKEYELLQIPHFTETVLGHCKKGKQSIGSLKDFIDRDPAERKGTKDMNAQQIADIDAFCKHITDVDLEASIRVEGVEEDDDSICMRDTATVTVKLTRTNLGEGQAQGPVHAPYYPDPKFEEWWIFVTEVNSPKIIAMDKIRDPSKNVEAKLQIIMWKPFMENPGKHKYEVHAICDSYLGVDKKKVIEFTVLKAPDDEVSYMHPEDAELDNHPTLFQQIAGYQNDQVDSDAEEEEEDDEPQSKKASSKKKQKGKDEDEDDDSSSASEGEEDEKDDEDKDEKDGKNKDKDEKDEKSKKDKDEKQEKSKKGKKEKEKKNKKDKSDGSDSSSNDSSDSDSDEDPQPKKQSGPCSGCVLC